MVPIGFEMVVFREEKTLVAYSPELDLSSCGASVEEARANLKTAVRLFLEEAEKLGTLKDILAEAGYRKDRSGRWNPPSLIALELVELA
jgi:predicted RNase H-like HicB family nuclease